MADESVTTFPSGSTVVRRDVLRGQVWSAAPYRVIEDDGITLTIACWPGVVLMAPTTLIEWNRSGDVAVLSKGFPIWRTGNGTWTASRGGTQRFSFGTPRERFSVSRFFDSHNRCGPWYVDFIQPPRRTPLALTRLTSS